MSDPQQRMKQTPPSLVVGNVEIRNGQVIIGGMDLTGGSPPSPPSFGAPPHAPAHPYAGQAQYPPPGTIPAQAALGTRDRGGESLFAPTNAPTFAPTNAPTFAPTNALPQAPTAPTQAVQAAPTASAVPSLERRPSRAEPPPPEHNTRSAVPSLVPSTGLELAPLRPRELMGLSLTGLAALGAGTLAVQTGIPIFFVLSVLFPLLSVITGIWLWRRHRSQPVTDDAHLEHALVLLADQQGGRLRVVDVVRTHGLSFDDAQAVLNRLVSKGHAVLEFDPETQGPVYRLG